MWRRPSSVGGPQLLMGKAMAITGGVTGIGRAIVVGYLTHGADVAVNHLGDSKSSEQFQSLLEEASQSLGGKEAAQKRLIEVPGDVSDPETGKKLIKAVVDKWGHLDVFISNAGICEFREFLEITPELWNKTVATNLTGAYNTIHAAATQLSKQSPPGGSIIGISSISALVGGAQQGHYTPTKAGVLSLIQSSACALGKYNIRCNALLPGTIKTQLNEKDLDDESKRKYMEGRIPLGRTGVPSDLAGPAVFLDSHIHLWPDPHTSTPTTSYSWMQPDHFLAKAHEIPEYLSVTSPKPAGFVYVETDRYLPSPTPNISSDAGDEGVKKELGIWAKEPLEEIRFLKGVAEGENGDLMKGVVLWAPFNISPALFQAYLHVAENVAGLQLWARVVGFRFLLQGKKEGEVAALVKSEDWIQNVVSLGEGRGGMGWAFDVGVDVNRDGELGLEDVREMIREVRRREEGSRRGRNVKFVLTLKQLSSDENVFMKLSGAFNEFSPESTSTPTDLDDIVAKLSPYLDTVFNCFPNRVMFGSDWPVCNVGGPKGEKGNWGFWVQVVERVLQERGYGEKGKEAVWWETGARAYAVDL
ncbi:NAD(P)-binding protein [Setomelanomma holmii]|uniref:NAD(P)-binding protein n=1 Tax=Setomelanomma holmii TaxID=210430 RepID=A0A9P4HDK8_9PLEO|nr:NAD(P)-binding protein [Setomelanomma holmii]